jgi:hypothetical protein
LRVTTRLVIPSYPVEGRKRASTRITQGASCNPSLANLCIVTVPIFHQSSLTTGSFLRKFLPLRVLNTGAGTTGSPLSHPASGTPLTNTLFAQLTTLPPQLGRKRGAHWLPKASLATVAYLAAPLEDTDHLHAGSASLSHPTSGHAVCTTTRKSKLYCHRTSGDGKPTFMVNTGEHPIKAYGLLPRA